MAHIHAISADPLSLDALARIIKNRWQLALSDVAREAADRCAVFLQNQLATTDHAYYGINTGFGSLCQVRIPSDAIRTLQANLVRSHACGVGDIVPPEIVRLMLILKIHGLALGYSGIRATILERLIRLYNDEALPVIYQLGSLGASGDLAPLAHLSLPLIGEGMLMYKNKTVPTPQYLSRQNLKPLELEAKEGLALLNGTQFCTAYAAWCLMEGQRLLDLATLTAAIALKAYQCTLEPFDARLHHIRPHKGQQKIATDICRLLADTPDSADGNAPRQYVQDPYAFRCVPQVHGASFDVWLHVKQVVETEINSVTDNPTLFTDDAAILSGGNFHAQPIAMALDYLGIALAELGSISERRVFQLLSGQRGLPVYLTSNGGVESGLMLTQYTAAGIVSQNKQLAAPASVDSIVSSNGQEDHVSMGANAATKCYRIVENLERLLAIEFLVAMQAFEYRFGQAASGQLSEILRGYRQVVPTLSHDRILSDDIHKTIVYLREKKHF